MILLSGNVFPPGTMVPAATMQLFPIVTPFNMIAPYPIQQLSPILIFALGGFYQFHFLFLA